MVRLLSGFNNISFLHGLTFRPGFAIDLDGQLFNHFTFSALELLKRSIYYFSRRNLEYALVFNALNQVINFSLRSPIKLGFIAVCTVTYRDK